MCVDLAHSLVTKGENLADSIEPTVMSIRKESYMCRDVGGSPSGSAIDTVQVKILMTVPQGLYAGLFWTYSVCCNTLVLSSITIHVRCLWCIFGGLYFADNNTRPDFKTWKEY